MVGAGAGLRMGQETCNLPSVKCGQEVRRAEAGLERANVQRTLKDSKVSGRVWGPQEQGQQWEPPWVEGI